MRKSSLALLLFVLLIGRVPVTDAQPQLAGSIGLDGLPDDSETMCIVQTHNYGFKDFDNTGIAAGWLVPDFTLYTLDSTPVNEAKLLGTGKPLLLIDGSYTCNIFRNVTPQINNLYQRYSKDVSIYVVYVLEAHTIIDTCDYVDSVWVEEQNWQEHIFYRQPKTYAARKAMVDTMISRMQPSLKAPVILDGPCDRWWRTFGPAPNNSYLIGTDGRVIRHDGWFPGDSAMGATIDSVLGRASVGGTASGSLGKLWPNPVPAGGYIHMPTSPSARFTLSDVLGRDIARESVPDDGSVSLGATAPGAYFYRLEQSGSVTTGRLIVSP